MSELISGNFGALVMVLSGLLTILCFPLAIVLLTLKLVSKEDHPERYRSKLVTVGIASPIIFLSSAVGMFVLRAWVMIRIVDPELEQSLGKPPEKLSLPAPPPDARASAQAYRDLFLAFRYDLEGISKELDAEDKNDAELVEKAAKLRTAIAVCEKKGMSRPATKELLRECAKGIVKDLETLQQSLDEARAEPSVE